MPPTEDGSGFVIHPPITFDIDRRRSCHMRPEILHPTRA
jgi:hypothetical protein